MNARKTHRLADPAARLLALLAALSTLALLLFAESAVAETPEPAWNLHLLALPTHFSPAEDVGCVEGIGQDEQHPPCDAYQLSATDVGAKQTSGGVTITDTLPTGVQAQRIDFLSISSLPGKNITPLPGGDCNLVTVSCHYTGAVLPDETLQMIVYVTVGGAQETTLSNLAKVEGGHAAAATTESQNVIDSTPAPFGPAGLSNSVLGSDGSPQNQAGAHPYELQTRIDLNTILGVTPIGGFEATGAGDPRDIAVDLPVGFLGTALATPTCSFAELSSHVFAGVSGCPADTIVGRIHTEPNNQDSAIGPIYNMTPEHGVAAEFGFVDLLAGAHVLYASVVPTPAGYVLRTTAREIPQITLSDIITSFYGNPEARNGGGAEGQKEVPFFTNPADCDGRPLITSVHMDSWQHPGTYLPDGEPDLSEPNWVTKTFESAEPVSGCDQLAGLFKPSLEVHPTTTQSDQPSGLDVTLKVPQDENSETLATPPLKKAVVNLPEGMSVNPSSANGLQGCSLAEIGIDATTHLPDAAAPNCPDAAKIGTLELETPALPGILDGQIYVAKPSENPFGTLLALYLVVDDPTTGVVIKIPGEIKANPETGQLTTVVDNSPQFPFSELRTHFFGGQRAPLRTPAVCATYKATSSLTPWSAPASGPPATPAGSFKVGQSASGEGTCPESAAEEPAAFSFEAGTVSPIAGAYSPFVVHLKRADGSQELSGLDVALPEGLLGKLAGVQECSEEELAVARSREREGGGAEEPASPSCPAASEVGKVTVGAGAGLTPYFTTGRVYLAGPYKGAPLSLAIITPAVAGPFDLGDVLVRVALQVDPYTAQIHAVSDPLPHILDGIPLDIRSVALQMDRQNFTLNPTSCETKQITGTATTVQGQSALLSNRFQVGGCNMLGFKPRLKLSLKGSTKRTGVPALKAVLTYPKGSYANIASVSTVLPRSEYIDQAHIGDVCTRVQFNSGAGDGSGCPRRSILGHATAYSPLLENPLKGTVYFRSNGSERELPDIVVALRGQIDVTLVGFVDSVGKKGAEVSRLRTRFENVPDAPVSRFVLQLAGAKHGLLENSAPLCKVKNVAQVKMVGQNGKTYDTEPIVKNDCKKGHHRGKHHHRGK